MVTSKCRKLSSLGAAEIPGGESAINRSVSCARISVWLGAVGVDLHTFNIRFGNPAMMSGERR